MLLYLLKMHLTTTLYIPRLEKFFGQIKICHFVQMLEPSILPFDDPLHSTILN